MRWLTPRGRALASREQLRRRSHEAPLLDRLKWKLSRPKLSLERRGGDVPGYVLRMLTAPGGDQPHGQERRDRLDQPRALDPHAQRHRVRGAERARVRELDIRRRGRSDERPRLALPHSRRPTVGPTAAHTLASRTTTNAAPPQRRRSDSEQQPSTGFAPIRAERDDRLPSLEVCLATDAGVSRPACWTAS